MIDDPKVQEAVHTIRTDWKKGDDARDAGLPTHPEDIDRKDNIIYGDADPIWQRLDVYRPTSAGHEPLPVIVSVHGGGWVYGTKETYQFYCMDLARRGFAVINYSYRLAPEWQFPTPFEDTNLVMSWMIDHASEFGFDLGHVYGVGDSAGGHMLGFYAALVTNPELAKRINFAKGSIAIPKALHLRAIALNCGEYKVLFDQKNQELTVTLMKAYLPGNGTAEELALMDLTDHITPAYPPTFLMTATGDFLAEQAPVMAEALMAASVPFVLGFYGDSEHSLGHVFHCDVKSPWAKLCNDDECAFFRRFGA